jgi:LacI family transcriptional regulator
MAKPRVTLKDVASVSGVSVPTASRVLNGRGRVSLETRDRVLLAAQRLDFQPNALAVFLASGRSHTVGVLAQDAPALFAAQVVTGVTAELGRRDMATLLYDSGHDRASLQQNVRKFEARRIDGLVVVGDGTGELLRSVSLGFSIPVVYVFGVSDDADDVSFVPDGRMGGRLAGEHLISLGRRNIAHITALNDMAAGDRAAGLRDALDTAGLALAGGAPMRGDWSAESGMEAARRLLRSGVAVDAIFCGNDAIASGVYHALSEVGLKVPDDVALVGMDNADRDIAGRRNWLTTIDPQLGDLGRAAVEYLMTLIGGAEPEPGVHYRPCVLVDRASTSVVPA